MSTGGLTSADQTAGAEAIIDATVTNTPIFVRNSQPSNGQLAGSLVLNNIQLNNVPVAVGVLNGATVLSGGTTTILHWVQGNVFTGTNPTGRFVQGTLAAPTKASSLLTSSGKIVSKTHPQYANYAVSQFVSIRDLGAKGDGQTDDTQAIKNALAQVSFLISHRAMTLIAISVRWLQDHILRPGHISCLIYYHHSCWNSDRRRSMVCDYGRWIRIQRHQQSCAGRTGW